MAYDFDNSGSAFKLFKSGRAIKDEVMDALTGIHIELASFLPSMCELESFSNAEERGKIGYALEVGDDIAVYGYAAGNIFGSLMFKGNVHSLEVRIDPGNGARMVVRAYDPGHAMLSIARTKAYKQKTYSDVVKEIAKKYSLDPLIGSAVTSTPVKHELVVQANETDWDFICRLARSIGFVAFVQPYELLKQSKTRLYFGPAMPASKGRSTTTGERGFKVGDGRLVTVRAMVSGAGLPSQAQAAGWDVKTAKAALSTTSVGSKATQTASPKKSVSSMRSSKAGTRMMLETVATSKGEATALAKGYAARFGGAAVDVELVVRGHPAAKVNTAIYLDEAAQLTGKYTISAVTHDLDVQTLGFTSVIYCSGLEDRTIAGLQGEIANRPIFTGVYPAIVSSIKDPKKLGRVQLTLPWLDSAYLTGWVPIVQMGAGGGTGWQALPAPQDEVLVSFQNGQLDSPYVIGGFYGTKKGKVSPDKLHKDGTPIQQAFTTKAGHQIVFRDDDEKSGIAIRTKNGESLLIDMSDKKGITIITKGENKPVKVVTDSDVVVTTKKNAKLSAQDVSVDAKGKVNVKAKGAATVSGQSVSVEASGKAKLKGASVSVEASGALNLKASGAVNIKGSAVNLN